MTQLDEVRRIISDGKWRTLRQIALEIGCPDASVGSRIRDLRIAGWEIRRRKTGDPRRRVYEYRYVVPCSIC